MQTTLIIVKPDGVQRGLMGEIISRFENKGMTIIGAKMITITREMADKHYAAHVSKPFYPSLVKFMTSSPVLVLAIRGKSAIAAARLMMGPTAGYEAAPGTIRGDFGSSKSFNLIHGSDSEEAAKTELGIFFKPEELMNYERATHAWTVDMAGGKAM